MSNQWLKKYHENFRCNFTISNLGTSLYSSQIHSVERHSRLLQFFFKDEYGEIEAAFIRECQKAVFGHLDCSHEITLSVIKISNEYHDQSTIAHQWNLEVLNPIKTLWIEGSSGKVIFLRLDVECSNIDGIDLRYFNQKK